MIRMRVQYRKTGAIRYTSHLDTVRMFQRGFKASGMPVSYSQGYHPHPRMSFGPPLKTGWEGFEEYFDCYLDSSVEIMAERCNPHLPDGLRITGSANIPGQLPKLPVSVSGARFIVRIDRTGRGAAGELGVPESPAGNRNAEPKNMAFLRPFERTHSGGGEDEPVLLDAAFSRAGDTLWFEYTCTIRGGKYLSPESIAREALLMPEMNGRLLRVARTKLFVGNHNDFASPLEEGERLETSEAN